MDNLSSAHPLDPQAFPRLTLRSKRWIPSFNPIFLSSLNLSLLTRERLHSPLGSRIFRFKSCQQVSETMHPVPEPGRFDGVAVWRCKPTATLHLWHAPAGPNQIQELGTRAGNWSRPSDAGRRRWAFQWRASRVPSFPPAPTNQTAVPLSVALDSAANFVKQQHLTRASSSRCRAFLMHFPSLPLFRTCIWLLHPMMRHVFKATTAR